MPSSPLLLARKSTKRPLKRRRPKVWTGVNNASCKSIIKGIIFAASMTFYIFRTIPQQGNTAEIVLNVLHRNFLGVDEFLGMVSMPLRDFDVYERPKTKYDMPLIYSNPITNFIPKGGIHSSANQARIRTITAAI